MWVWLYGLSISIFLILQELGANNMVSLTPLVVLTLGAALELIFRIVKYPKCDLWPEWLNTGFLFSMSFTLLLLVSLQVERHISFNVFFITLTVIIGLLSALYLMLKGQYTIFANSPMKLRVANGISYTTTVATYLCFYGVEYDSIVSWVPLIPFGICVISEMYIFWTLYNGIDELEETFTKRAAMDRLAYMVCVSILMVCAILHYASVVKDLFLYTASSIAYFSGIVVVMSRSRKNLCRNVDCCKKAKYLELKSDDINPEEGETNNE